MFRSGSESKAGLSPSEVDDLYKSVKADDSALQKRRDADSSSAKASSIARRVGGKVVDAAEVGAGAALIGYAAGRTGSTTIGPVPTGLGVATAYYVAEALSFSHLSPLHYVPEGFHGHLENIFGKGALAGFAAMWGVGQGYLAKQKSEEAAAEAEKNAPAKAAGRPAQMAGRVRTSEAPNLRTSGGAERAANRVGCDQPRRRDISGYLTEAELQAIEQKKAYRR